MFKNKLLFLIVFSLFSLSFLFSPTITRAYDSDSLKTDLDYFFGLGAKGYLVWQYSGNRLLNPIENDQFSFFSDDKAVCDILKAKASTLSGDQFIGVNMHSIVRHLDQADTIFGYLSSCGVTVVRTFTTKDRGSVGDYQQLLGIAGSHQIKLIMALADWSNGTPGIIDPDTAYPNPAGWYTQAAQSGSSYSNYLEQLVSGLRGNPNIYGYELANEPHCGNQQNCIGPYNNWISASAGRIRSIDSNTKVGVGQAANLGVADTPNPGNFKSSNSAGGITITSGHYYTLEQRANAAQAKQESDSLGKPFYIGEAGFSGGGIPGHEDENEFPCNKTSSNEFHNLRPYPKNPCNKKIEEVTLSCGNDLYTKKGFEVSKAGSDECSSTCDPAAADGSQVCKFQCNNVHTKISVDLSKAELPIAGNTELVPNATSKETSLDLKQRLNQYVSWYLNGTINMPFEDDFSKLATLSNTGQFILNSEGLDRLVNLSGPLNKLLPWHIGASERIQQVDDANASKNGEKEIRHDQVAVCSTLPGWRGGPIPCFGNDHRFTEWEGVKPPWEDNPSFKYVDDYWKAFIEWEGGHCTRSISVADHQFYACDISFTGGQSFFSEFMSYLLPSSTEDRKGEASVSVTQNDQTFAGAHTTNIAFELNPATNDRNSHSLYFAHMQEDAELAKLLQGTFASLGQPGYSSVDSDGKSFPVKPHCEIADGEFRTNPGDKLYGNYDNPKSNEKQISGDIKYDASFTCKFDPPKPCAPGEVCTQTCKQFVYAGISVFTKTPKAQEVWERLVDGPSSVFKRFFPQVGVNSPLTDIKDLPTIAKASYSSSTGGVETLAGDPSKAKPGSDAQLVIPYLGGVQEYFLKGIQKALRPQGFDSEDLAGINNTPYDPGTNDPSSTTNQCVKLADVIPNGIPFRDTSIKPKPKEELYNLIKTRFPTTQLLTYYDEVVSKAIASGYNPAFVLTIWIEETGASATQYGLVHDLGCGSGHGISEQLDCFTGLYSDWSMGGKYYSDVKQCLTSGVSPDFEDFMLLFAEGCQGAVKNNRQFCFHNTFPNKILTFYNLVKDSPTIIQF